MVLPSFREILAHCSGVEGSPRLILQNIADLVKNN